MKKYKVMREMPFAKVGEVIPMVKDEAYLYWGAVQYPISAIQTLVRDGWLAEVPDEKELWEKIYNYFLPCTTTECTARGVTKIASQHFAEVARKASNEWVAQSSLHYNISITEHIIQVIEQDGEK